jgi:hypothetical protein
VYSLDQTKRGLFPYDDKRYLLADLPDGSPNPNTHAYGHKDLAGEEHLVEHRPERPGDELVVERKENRFDRRHQLVLKKVAAQGRRDSNGENFDDLVAGEELPDGYEHGEIHGADLERAERAAAARQGVGGRLGQALIDIMNRQNLQMPDSPPRLMPTPVHQRPGPSGTNRPAGSEPKRRLILYSSDEEEEPRPRAIWLPALSLEEEEEPRRKRKQRRRTCALIDDQAGVDGTASADEDDFEEDPTLNGFIVDDDVFE